jgi:hypothetical protein
VKATVLASFRKPCISDTTLLLVRFAIDNATVRTPEEQEEFWCWAPPGVRPQVAVQIVREYEYVYGAVSPQDGVLDTLVLPELHAEARGLFLAEVARRHADEFIVMVLDGAGWHKAKRLQVPANMRLISLPPWSPQLNPAEHVWDELREKYFANRWWPTMDHVDEH